MHAGPVVTITRDGNLTGRICFVDRVFGFWWPTRAVMLQVEESYETATYSAPRPDDLYDWTTRTRWRAATAMDLADPALRWIIDGRLARPADNPDPPPDDWGRNRSMGGAPSRPEPGVLFSKGRDNA